MSQKLVEFEKWCPKCKWKDASDAPDPKIPCDECLEIPAREDSRIPEYYDGPLICPGIDVSAHDVPGVGLFSGTNPF